MGKVNTFPSALQNISTKSLLSNLKPSSTSSAAFTVSSPFNRSPNSSQSLTTSLSTISTTSPSQSIIIKISIPNHGLQKSIRCLLSDTVWSLKKQLLEKTANEIPNAFNYGFYLPGLQGKQGKFLEEKRELFSYKFQEPTVWLLSSNK